MPHAIKGNTDSHNEAIAAAASTQSAAGNQRERRHSSRQVADAFDEFIEFPVIRLCGAHAPAPQRIVLAIEQARERRALVCIGLRIATIQPACQQLVELAHATTAAPAQARDFGIVHERRLWAVMLLQVVSRLPSMATQLHLPGPAILGRAFADTRADGSQACRLTHDAAASAS